VAQLSIVVTCTSTKRVSPPSTLLARNLPSGTVSRRLRAWQVRLAAAEERTPLRVLYGGPAWAQVEPLEDAARRRGWTPRVYVASAGLGLRAVDSSAPAYAATFSSESPDRVAEDLAGRARWWHGLADLDGASALSDLDGDAVLLVLGATYAAAMARDLTQMGNRGSTPLFLVGGGSDLPQIRRVPADRRLRQALGGAATSLGTRTAAAWLNLATPSSLGSRRHERAWQSYVAQNSADDAYHRERLSDQAVINVVRGLLRVQPQLSRTQALQILRAQGFACEQRRFAALFSALSAA
jgi:hypothetical protein